MSSQFEKDRMICMTLGDETLSFYGAVAPPLFQNSLFSFPNLEKLHQALDNEKENVIYTRGNNPTVALAEKKIAALERTESAKLFSSGMAAISSVLFTLCKSGSHVLCLNSIYGPTIKYLTYMHKFGIDHTVVTDVTEESIVQALRPETSIIYCESPGTMTFRIIDLAMITGIVRKRNITTVIDNTWATPLFQKPILHGFDVVLHSCTKYMGGHSDLVAGVVAGKKDVIDRVFDEAFMQHGGVLGPFECLLLLRGLRTLPDRLLRHQTSAAVVAEYLCKHPRVKQVFYAALPHDSDHTMSVNYLTGYTGLFSFEIDKAGNKELVKIVNACKHFKIGVSWGGYESLIFAPNNGKNTEQLKSKGIPEGLIRISVGLEDPQILINDLEQALAVT